MSPERQARRIRDGVLAMAKVLYYSRDATTVPVEVLVARRLAELWGAGETDAQVGVKPTMTAGRQTYAILLIRADGKTESASEWPGKQVVSHD